MGDSTLDLRSTIQYYIYGLWDKRWSIVLVAWVICIAGWLFVSSLPNRYESQTRIYVDTQTLLGPLMQGLAVRPDIERQVEIMRRTLLSRPNVEQVIRMTDLDHLIVTDVDLDNLVATLGQSINVRTEGSGLFRIAYESMDPNLSQRVVDSTLQIFVEQNLGNTQRDMETAQRFIDQQIKEYEAKLRDAELKVAEFRRLNADELSGAERALRQLEVRESELRRLESTLQSAIWQRDQLKARLASTPQSLSQTQSASGTSAKRRELEKLEDDLEQLLTSFTDRHPDVVRLKTRIDSLRDTVGTAGTQTIEINNPDHERLAAEFQLWEQEIGGLERRIEVLNENIDELSFTAAQAPAAEAELTHLTRDYTVLLSQYEELIQRRESARLAERLDTEADNVEFRIIEPPMVPVQPSGPNRIALVAAVLFAGLGAGFGLALLRVQLSSSLINASQITDRLGVPVFGSLSVVASAASNRLRALEVTGLAGVASSLFACCILLIYLFYLNPSSPDLVELATGLQQQIERQIDVWL